MTGDNGMFCGVLARTKRAFGLVEAERSLSAGFVGSVAFETAIAQNRPDIPIKLNGGRLGGLGKASQKPG